MTVKHKGVKGTGSATATGETKAECKANAKAKARAKAKKIAKANYKARKKKKKNKGGKGGNKGGKGKNGGKGKGDGGPRFRCKVRAVAFSGGYRAVAHATAGGETKRVCKFQAEKEARFKAKEKAHFKNAINNNVQPAARLDARIEFQRNRCAEHRAAGRSAKVRRCLKKLDQLKSQR